MKHALNKEDILPVEAYEKIRAEKRGAIIARKKNRRISVGPYATFYFENYDTMWLQVQEMLRLERIFEPELIQEELDVYNPLIPDGANWKATFMVEYPDVEERKVALAKLIGVEKTVYVQVADFSRVKPIANEDLERETEGKTSAVHFLRFELTPEMAAAAKAGAPIRAGIDHVNYKAEITLAAPVRESLASDLA